MRNRKIRGLRRHFRLLRQLAAVPAVLGAVDHLWLNNFRQTFCNVRVSPWGLNQPPPRAFRQLWTEHLVRTFQHWSRQLSNLYPDHNLALWLYPPTAKEFQRSRLIVTLGERRLIFDELLGEPLTLPLPREYRSIPGIDAIRWQAHARLHYFSPQRFAYNSEWVADKPHWPGTNAAGEDGFFVQHGWVWVGLPTVSE